MNYLSNLKIGTRLSLVLGVLVFLLIALGLQAAVKVGGMHDEMADVTGRRMVIVEKMNEYRHELNLQARLLRTLFIMTDPSDIKTQREEITKSSDRVLVLDEVVNKLVTSGKGRELGARIEEERAKYRALRDRILALLEANKQPEAAQVLLKEMRTQHRAYEAALQKQIDFQTEGARAEALHAADQATSLKIAIGIEVAIAVVFSIAVGIFLVRSITRPMDEAVELARAVADGDLSRPIEVHSKDETGQLLQALSDMQGSLARVVATVRTGSDSVSTASSEIAQGNQDLSSRTESQASSLQETAASMEELSSTVRQNADNAREANQLAQSASTVAVQGGEVVGRVVDTMRGISDASKKIADIISVIDGIAFQTNILALNAAVEAARAGEQGRGFAVVAGEVRTLAGRSAEAAKEIKSLITDSVTRVEEGTQLADRAGHTMEDVVAAIKRVTDIMGEISSASMEQSQGVAQVGEAVSNMDQVTQQNAALVEEMAAAASSLRGQAQELVQTVSVFKVPGGFGGSGGSAPRMLSTTSSAPVAKPAARPALARPAPAKPKSSAPVKGAPAAVAAAGGADGDWESF